MVPQSAGEPENCRLSSDPSGNSHVKITIYAEAITAIQQRMAPVFLALRDAAATDTDCAALWSEIATRRANNMRAFAADLRRTGDVRDDPDFVILLFELFTLSRRNADIAAEYVHYGVAQAD